MSEPVTGWGVLYSDPDRPATQASVSRARGMAGQASFERLWRVFMSARMLLALAIFGLHLSAYWMAQGLSLWTTGFSLAYLLLTVLQRFGLQPRGPGQSFGAQWLVIIGLDLLYVSMLQSQLLGDAQQLGGLSYIPLLALPVLMAAILGTRPMAMGTAALAALLLLGVAALNLREAAPGSAAELAQSGLLGAGLLALAWLTNFLAVRLEREQQRAQRSQAQAQLQSLVSELVIDSMSDGVLVVDADAAVHSANPAARSLLGSDQEVIPEMFRLTDHAAWIQLLHVARLSFRDGPIDVTDILLHHEDRHAGKLRVRTERTPPMGPDDPGLCVMFLQDVRDMEERVRIEKLAAMGRMSAAVAHEFRNPLAAITQANALLQEEAGDAMHQRLTDMIGQNAKRLLHIVDDVMDVTQVQAQADAALEAVSLDEQVAQYCDEWAAQNRVGPRLRQELLADGVYVRVAHEHLRRLLVNLLDNAIRYASPEDGAIRVETRAIRHGPVVLSVWSDGEPIDAAVRPHLFEPFFSSESRSSGLGLFICQELCGRHGATIGYEPREREHGGRRVTGNEFFIEFRRAPSGHTVWSPDDSEQP